jgi:hypothetical protein
MFSDRLPQSLAPNRLTEAVRRARATNRRVIDLTVTNPTLVGLDYDRRCFNHSRAAARSSTIRSRSVFDTRGKPSRATTRDEASPWIPTASC